VRQELQSTRKRDGVEEADRAFADIIKGLRMFKGIILIQMIWQRIEDTSQNTNGVGRML
jgi:hypothetical protein